jgi:hypothetical protein
VKKGEKGKEGGLKDIENRREDKDRTLHDMTRERMMIMNHLFFLVF